MEGTTLIVAVVASVLVLSLRPSYALAAYITVLVWYPDYLRVSIGTIDISAGRIVVTVLLLRCLLSNRIWGKFVWHRLDTLVTLSMVVYVVIYCVTHPFSAALENRGGFLMDTWFAYISVRLIMTDKDTLISFIKCISIILLSLAILGVIESFTHWQPFVPLKRFRPWRIITGDTIVVVTRWGFARAIGPFSHSIMFGSCLVMFLPLIWAMRHQQNTWGKLSYPLSGMILTGVFFSMSSGPWVAGLATVFGLTMERYKRWVKPLLITTLITYVFLSVVANRPVYQILYSHANLAGGSYWQRVQIIDSAIENFDEWWFLGYGNRDPGWKQSTADFTDLNNEFIKAGVEYGLLGIIVLCAVLVGAFRGLVSASKKTRDIKMKSLYWALGCSLFGIIVSWQGVSFFGTPVSLFYFIVGTVGSSIGFAEYTKVKMVLISESNNMDMYYPRYQINQTLK